MLLEGIHAPELVLPVADNLLCCDQSLKRLHNQFLAGSHVVEYLLFEHEKTGIDQNVGFPHALDAVDEIFRLEFDDVEALRGLRAQERGDLPALDEAVNQVGERKTAQSVGIVGQKHLFSLEIFFDRLQALADIRSESGIDEGYFPVGDVALPKLYVPAAIRHREIV